MLQRIQTVFMALMIIALLGLLFAPIFNIDGGVLGQVKMGAFVTDVKVMGKSVESTKNFFIGVLAILAVLVLSYSIYCFKDRPMQLKLALVNNVILLSLFGLMLYYRFGLIETYSKILPNASAKFGIGFIVPVLCLVLNRLAVRFIKKDEKLVKDAFERLR